MKKLLATLFICLAVLAVYGQKKEAKEVGHIKREKHLVAKDYQYDSTKSGSIEQIGDSVSIKTGKVSTFFDFLVSAYKVTYRKVTVRDSTGAELLSLTKNDTLVVGAVKFLRIGDKVFNVEALKQNEIIGLPLQYWQAVIEMLRNATGVNMKPEEMVAVINAIIQQLPRR